MIAAGMLSWSGAEAAAPMRLKATRLGRVAIRHFLAPATVLLFRRVLTASADWSFFDLLLVAAASEDCEPILPVDYEELETLADRLSRERSLLLRRPRKEMAGLLGIDGKRLLAAFKTALAAREWTRSGDAEAVAKGLSCYPFEVRRLQESMERLLTGMAAAQEPPKPEPTPAPADEVAVRERLRVLQRMVAAGLDEEVVTLTLVPGIGPRLARRLHAAGVGDIEALAQSTAQELASVRGLSARRAGRWIDTATRLVPICSAFRYREHGPANVVRSPDWPVEIDPYRLRRALDLKVRDGGESFEVTGGLEPHLVRLRGPSFECDCPDRAVGNLCKHILAVRLSRGEEGLRQLVERVGAQSEEWGIDLFALWVSQGGRS
jgi:helicase